MEKRLFVAMIAYRPDDENQRQFTVRHLAVLAADAGEAGILALEKVPRHLVYAYCVRDMGGTNVLLMTDLPLDRHVVEHGAGWHQVSVDRVISR